MKLFYILSIVTILNFIACGELDDEFPTITLDGDSDITLKIDTFINEPGFSAKDPQDGDLTKDVNISTNLDYSRAGNYEVKYYTSDSEGNKVTQIRKIKITNDGFNSGKYTNYKPDSSLYYLPSYLYPSQTLVSGTSVSNTAYSYDKNGKKIDLENKTISYQKDGDAIKKESNHDMITLEQIRSFNDNDNLVSKYPVKMRVGNDFIDDDESCHISEKLENFTTIEVTKTLSDNKTNFYENVLHIECNSKGIKDEIYYAKGKGEVLRITEDRIILVEPSL